LAQELRSLTDPESGEHIFDGVWLREEVYSGPELERLPHIFYRINRRYRLNNRPSWQIVSTSRLEAGTGHHDGEPEGIFIAHGPAIVPGELEGARIIDVAPTVLRLFGLAVPSDMDGKPLDILRPEVLGGEARSVEVARAQPGSSESFRWGEEEEEKVAERLRGLGYLD